MNRVANKDLYCCQRVYIYLIISVDTIENAKFFQLLRVKAVRIFTKSAPN